MDEEEVVPMIVPLSSKEKVYGELEAENGSKNTGLTEKKMIHHHDCQPEMRRNL